MLIRQLCNASSKGKMDRAPNEVGEVGERELVFVVSVRCGKERDMTRG